MDKEFWLKKWENNGFSSSSNEIDLDLIRNAPLLNLEPGDTILVPLCGKTPDMMWLAEQGYHVIGIELASIACEDFFKQFGITPEITRSYSGFTHYKFNNIELLCGDIFDLTADHLPKISAVYDHKALVALSPEMQDAYVNHIFSFISHKKGSMLVYTLQTDNDVKGPPFPINETKINALYGAKSQIKKIKSEPLMPVPKNLAQKGYHDVIEEIYLMIINNE